MIESQKALKIIFLGDINFNGRTAQRLRLLERMGHVVYSINSYYQSNSFLLQKVINLSYKLRRPIDMTQVNKKLLSIDNLLNYEILWIEKAVMLKSSSLKIIKKIHPKIKILFNSEDDMFKSHNNSDYFIESLNYLDLFVTTKSDNLNPSEKLKSKLKKVLLIDKSYSKELHKPIKNIYDHFKNDVLFIGTYEKERANSLAYLLDNGVKVTLWGEDWNQWAYKNHKNVKMGNKGLYGQEYVNEICLSKISLCFLRKINNDKQTGRSIEIPACGSFMLAEYSEEHAKLFRENQEAVFFKSNDDLLQKVQHYLRQEDKRIEIAKAGRQRCLSSGYSHQDRINQMLLEIL